MPSFTFIHAADLHLGAPFRGLDGAASDVFDLGDAGFEALRRLEDACVESGASFLVLSGDIYDDKDGVLRARFALRDMFVRLEKAGVRVFIAHGNHDPLKSGPLPVSWPENVTVFGASPECYCVMAEGKPVALVHGVSHAGPRETANLAARFTRYAAGDASPAFASLPPGLPVDICQIAVLHCAVGGAGEGHAPYAPCALTDLTGAGFDYWALGHVHQGRVLSEAPFVVYPGSIQGLHINETGEHGCYAVAVREEGVSPRFLPLAPVTWRKLALDVGGNDAPESVDALEETMVAALDAAAREAGAAKALFCRVILRGHTDLDAPLRRPGSIATLLERLRKRLYADAGDGAAVWVKDIALSTSPARDEAALAERNDLVGEVVRLAGAAGRDGDLSTLLAGQALAPLYGNQKLKKILAAEGVPGEDLLGEDAPGGEPDMAHLAASAASLLISLLEDE